MSAEIALQRIRTGALVLMPVTVGLMLYYGGRSFFGAWRFCFGEPDRWNTHWRVDPGTVVDMTTRTQHFLLWSMVLIAGILGYLAGLYVLNRCRQGLIFDLHTARAVRALGAIVTLAMLIDQVFAAIAPYTITRLNAEGPTPVRWVYDPSDFKLIALGLVVYLCGWVVQMGVGVAKENRGFV